MSDIVEFPKVEQVEGKVISIPDKKDWFIPVVDEHGDGTQWGVGAGVTSFAVAEEGLRMYASTHPVKQARIIKVTLPCAKIE